MLNVEMVRLDLGIIVTTDQDYIFNILIIRDGGSRMNYNIGSNDIPEDMVDFAELVGYDLFFRICEEYGGNQMYFPKKESLLRKARDRDIRSKYDGMNSIELSKTFGLTANQIRNIVVRTPVSTGIKK